MESASVAESQEKWRDLYRAEELPFGNEWKRAETIDPTEDRLFPDGPAPDWAVSSK
jgi:hypothetical protein